VTETISSNNICLKTFFLKVNICKLSFFHFLVIFNKHFFIFFLSILMVIISLELTRVNPNRDIFSINVELTSTFILYRGLVHHHHRILNRLQVRGKDNLCQFQYNFLFLRMQYHSDQGYLMLAEIILYRFKTGFRSCIQLIQFKK